MEYNCHIFSGYEHIFMTYKMMIDYVLTQLVQPKFYADTFTQYSRNVSQSRWIIDDERMGEASVEVLYTLAKFCCRKILPFKVDC